MEEIKAPKKERKFLRAMADIGLALFRELVLGIGKKLINKVGNKRQGLVIAAILFSSVTACAQYPGTNNKMRLGYQTTGDGLVYRGRASDTLSIKSSGLNNAYFILDTLNNIVYNYIKTKGGWQFTNGDTVIINNNFAQPADSLFFKTSVATNNVDTAKMRWDSDLGTVVLGMYDQVPNELGFKNFWLVKNQTGLTITKGSIVYANGTVGASGRITVAKFIANGSIESKYVLGITAHDLTDGEDGYVISFGKVRQVNTDTFSPGAILYPSPTVAGVWTDIEPIAPNIDMPIGFCINSHANNGSIAIRVASGYKLSELHDVTISSPVEKASLYYFNGLWRDTTAALLVSDTAAMLTNYAKIGTGGTVTSVAMTVPTLLSISGSPITTSGTLALTYSGAPLPILNGGTAATTISQARVNLQVPNISTTITPQAPLTGGGSLAGNRTISIPVATSIANGYLSSTDWSTFNGKQNAITLTTTGTSGAATLTGATLNIPQYSGGSGTVTNITVTSPLTITNPTTTPLIQINAANGTSSSGVVTTTTQQFGGAKTFNANLTTNGNMQVDGSVNVGTTGAFGGTLNIGNVTGTATSVIGRSSTGQVVGVTLGSGLSLTSGTLSATAGNEINVYLAINGPGIVLASSFGVYSHWYVNINQSSTVTITLPSASGNVHKTLYIKNSGTGAVNSNATNVEPLNSTTLGTAILTSGGGKYVSLVSNGTNWIKMSGN